MLAHGRCSKNVFETELIYDEHNKHDKGLRGKLQNNLQSTKQTDWIPKQDQF